MHYFHLLHKMNQLSSAQSVKRNSRRDKGCKDLLQQNTTQHRYIKVEKRGMLQKTVNPVNSSVKVFILPLGALSILTLDKCIQV